MIAREGLLLIFLGVVVTAITVLAAAKYDSKALFAVTLLFGILTLFTVFFFRDPVRKCDSHENILVAPADGRILSIENVANPYVGGDAVKISIFLSIIDVHINRIPATGRIDYVKYVPGKFFAAFREKASHLNERTEIGMTTLSGARILFRQIAGVIARRIVCNINEEDSVVAGERFGMIRFGSRAELVVPAGSKLLVRTGEHVAGGKTVMGYLPEKRPDPSPEDSTRESRVDL